MSRDDLVGHNGVNSHHVQQQPMNPVLLPASTTQIPYEKDDEQGTCLPCFKVLYLLIICEIFCNQNAWPEFLDYYLANSNQINE